MFRVFVYGTLLSGERNNFFLKDSEKVGDAVVVGQLQMRSLGPFPACFRTDWTEAQVVGEVWEVDDVTLERLNGLEGYHGEGFRNFYDRIKVETSLGEALVYIRDEAAGPIIPSGDWKKWLEELGE